MSNDLVAQLVEHWASKPMVACSIPTVFSVTSRIPTVFSVTSECNIREKKPLLDILVFKFLFFLDIKVKDIEKLLKRTTQVSENGWTTWFPHARYVCFFRVQKETTRYLKKHSSILISDVRKARSGQSRIYEETNNAVRISEKRSE